MKVVLKFLLVLSAVSIFFTGNAFADDAEQRIVEEEIVLQDPTVSAPKKWTMGFSGDLWYVTGPYYSYDDGVKVAEGDINGTMYGGNAYIGYGNWTFQYSYRTGDTDINFTRTNGTYSWNDEQDQEEHEITLRYLMRSFGSKHFVPYLLLGYNNTSLDKKKTITTSGWNWTATGTNTVNYENTYKSYMLGIGAVVPINKDWGFRGDIRGATTDAESKVKETGTTYSSDGLGCIGFLTAYWNIFKGINLQVGVKGQYLDGGDKVSSYSRLGFFSMLGYSHKF